MLPKEHGAWNALIICLASGWVLLGGWSGAALAATFFWLSGFILRAPLATARQYRVADPIRARKAAAFFLFLLAVLLVSGFFFAKNAPRQDLRLVFLAAAPLGLVLGIVAWVKRTLRFLPAEVAGFAGVSLAVPALYLSRPGADPSKACLFYALFGGYLVLALFYVKLRQDWLKRSRSGWEPAPGKRLSEGGAILALHALFPLIILLFTGVRAGWWIAPLYAFLRVGAGVTRGRPGLPLMKLGLREMLHSIVFAGWIVVAFYAAA